MSFCGRLKTILLYIINKTKGKKMTKIKLQTTGEILKEEFIIPYGISPNALAKAISVPANRIYQIVKGTRTAGRKNVARTVSDNPWNCRFARKQSVNHHAGHTTSCRT